MPDFTKHSVRRVLASSLLVLLASTTPTLASAQSLYATTGNANDAYVLDPSTSTLTFGNGAIGQTPTSGVSGYSYGGGAYGDTPSDWSFGCFVLRC
jgi:hypothetical protein